MLSFVLTNDSLNTLKADLLNSHFISAPRTTTDQSIWILIDNFYTTLTNHDQRELLKVKSPFLSRKMKNALCRLISKDKSLYNNTGYHDISFILDSLLKEYIQKADSKVCT